MIIDLLPGKEPFFGPLYAFLENELQILKSYIEKNLDSDFIARLKSSAGAPVLFIKKGDGSLRLCVDYRGLNVITIKNRYPIPLVSEILNRLRKATIFIKLDCRGAYNLLRIAEGNEWKTAFKTRYGSYEYNVMPFGLANVLATFQTYINNVLKDLLDRICIVYLDDILIYLTNRAQHKKDVKEVLRLLRIHGLFLKLEKCKFSTSSVKFLRYIIFNGAIGMDAARIATIAE